ncbi:MAG: hypothetical protein V4437_02975 [Patescibacteria group bacterium]
MIKNNFLSVLTAWLPLALVSTLLLIGVYIAVQQDLRLSANDPQIAIAEDSALQLEAGATPSSIVGLVSIDIAQSISTFVMVFDEGGKISASSGILHGMPLRLPMGVLAASLEKENRITWQPEVGVREALVVRHYGGAHPGFVAVGRSLRETEERIDVVGLNLGIIWLAELVLSFFLLLCINFFRK